MRGRESELWEAEPVSGDRRSRSVPSRAPGEIIAGKYALRRLLGRGGMGSVWQAKNVTLGADVAIKLILPSFVLPEAGERLFREACAAALLEHPGIVRVFDFGSSERREPFIVMELLRGSTLGELLATRRRLPAELAVQILLPVAGALAFAHARGVVHRDLKPDNVMLVTSPPGPVTPKIVDFGIAKLLHDERPLTRQGAVLGSPHYMAPEQACGAGNVDGRADVFAFCVVLYEAIAGFRPFEQEGRCAPLAVFFEEPASLTGLGLADDALWTILRRGLSLEREGRWPSMHALGVALAEWALARRIEVDVTGSRLDHCWRTPSRRPIMLQLPEPAVRTGTEDTQWVSPPPLPFAPPEDTLTAPPSAPNARRIRPALGLGLGLGALALGLLWIQLEFSGPESAHPASVEASPGLGSAAAAVSSGSGGERAPASSAAPSTPDPGPAPPPTGTPSAPPAEAPASPPARHKPAGMPLPPRPDF